MGSFGRGNPIIWNIILQNLSILLVYQRVFTFARLNPDYYYFFGRNVSPGQLILYINTSRCCVARFKNEKESKLLAQFIIQFITGSPTPTQVIQNELFREEILLCSNFGKSWAAPSLPSLCEGAVGSVTAAAAKGRAEPCPICSLEIKSHCSNFAPEPGEAARGRARCCQPKG